MRLDSLLQFIIPLTFLAIWALTSLLNRDSQPLPPRPGAPRPPGPGTGRSAAAGGFSPASRGELAGIGRPAPSARQIGAAADRAVPARWSNTPVQGRPGTAPYRSPGGTDDGITILESESRPASTSSFSPSSQAANPRVTRASTSATRKASSRSRSAPPAAPAIKPMEQERPRALTGLVGQALSQKRAPRLELVPLTTQITPITSPLMSSAPSVAPQANRAAAAPVDPPLSLDELRVMLGTPKRLREVALLGELLRPPVSMRPTRRRG